MKKITFFFIFRLVTLQKIERNALNSLFFIITSFIYTDTLSASMTSCFCVCVYTAKQKDLKKMLIIMSTVCYNIK